MKRHIILHIWIHLGPAQQQNIGDSLLRSATSMEFHASCYERVEMQVQEHDPSQHQCRTSAKYAWHETLQV